MQSLGETPTRWAVRAGKDAEPYAVCRGMGRSISQFSPCTPAPICCNRRPFRAGTMGVAYYLGLVGAGLVAAYVLTILLKGIRLI